MNSHIDETERVAEAALQEKDRAKKVRLVQRLAQEFRLVVLDTLHAKGTGHWGGAASVAELLVALYFDAMQVRPDEPAWPDRDRLVLSKGHASCMLYTVIGSGFSSHP
jgi:transketolase